MFKRVWTGAFGSFFCLNRGLQGGLGHSRGS